MKKEYKEDLPIDKLHLMNQIYKKYDKNCIPYQLCEVCIKPTNLSICEVCRNYFHSECIGLNKIPTNFFCPECEKISKSQEKIIISSFQEITDITISGEILDNTNIDLEKENSDSKRKLTNTRKPRRDMLTDLTTEAIQISSVTSTQKTKENSNEQESTKKVIKPRKKRINNFDDTITFTKIEKKTLFDFENSDIHFKRRKIRIGENHNLDMEEYYDRIENLINFDEEEYERQDMKKVWSVKENPLDENELRNYLNTARIFWNYRNIYVENELSADFFEDLNIFLNENKIYYSNKGQVIQNKIIFLKKFLKNGINFNCHFDEIALKILHICKYKIKIAMMFLYKQINPFIEEVEDGFKKDVVFFQKEIISMLSSDDDN